jgi:hypothetical protein
MTRLLCLFLLAITVLFNISCSSIIYPQKSKYRNNTVTFVTNLNNVHIKFIKEGKNYNQHLGMTSTYSGDKNQLFYTFDKLRYKQMKVELYGENLESQFVKIRRVPRGGAIVQDILFSTITFGLPIIIDPFRADFYKIAKGSRQFDIKMKYTQQFMLDEYKKIENSNIALNFENYLVIYDYSAVKQLAINKRDSLELFSAIQKSDEKKIDDFIRTRPESVFMPKATEVKNILKSSRVDFENSKKIDKAITYRKFIEKYPQSLQTNEAKKLMVNTAEKECLAANRLDSTIFYLDSYLLPNEQIVAKDFIAKIRIANNLIEKQIIDELYLSKSDKYEASKDMCEYYTNFKNKYKKYNDLTSLLQIDFLRGDIAIILFNKLKSATDQSTQSSFLDEAQKTFIDIYEENNWKKNLPISYHILIEARGKNGSIKLYNQQYVKNHLEHLGEAGSEFTDIYNYNYKGQKYKALENVDYEEFEIKEDVYVKVKLYYKGSLVVESDNRFKSDFYKNGQLVKTKFHKWDNNGNRIGYEYEFENGVNLTLKELSQKLDEAEKLTAQKEYQAAVTKFESCRNSFPQDIPENIRFKKSLDKAIALLEEYNKKQEEKRLAEEKRQEEIRLAEERRREQARLDLEKKNREISRIEEEKRRQENLNNIVSTSTARNKVVGTYNVYNSIFPVSKSYITFKSNGTGVGINLEDNLPFGFPEVGYIWNFRWEISPVKREHIVLDIIYLDQFENKQEKWLNIYEKCGKIYFPGVVGNLDDDCTPYGINFIKN